jgi:transcriptional regulator
LTIYRKPPYASSRDAHEGDDDDSHDDEGRPAGADRVPTNSLVDGTTMTKAKADLLQGTLDLLILKTLESGASHGWGISQRIQEISEDVLQINQGSLYPALHRLERQGWIRAEWGTSENNRRAKYYALTASGKTQLAEERETWERLSVAVARVLETA